MISSSMSVLHQYSDRASSSCIQDYDDDVIQAEELPLLEPELLDSVPAKNQTVETTSKPAVLASENTNL